MKFSITGVNHKSAPVEVRERLAFDESALSQALISLKGRPGFCEGMILSTCNRVEVALTCEENAHALGGGSVSGRHAAGASASG